MRFETAIEHLVDNYRYAKSKVWIRDKVAWALYHTWKEADDRKTENCSEKPNNCEHITEDGVTCAKYPACDDCLDSPLNKVKGSKRLLKGKTEPTISKMEQVDEPRICDTCRYYNSNIPCGSTPSACKEADKFAEEFVDGLKKLKPKDEPQTDRKCIDCKFLTYMFGKTWCNIKCENPHDEVCDRFKPKDEPQTDCSWK